MTLFRPILMAYNTLPSEDYISPFLSTLTGPSGVDKFFASYGMPIDWGGIERMSYTGPDYRTGVVNPYSMIYNFLIPDLGTNPDARALVIRTDWVEPANYGWGGIPIAIVGKYAADRLLTMGTPDAIVDDWHTQGLAAHEIGHALGYGHEYGSIMWEWWTYPNSNPSPAMVATFKMGAPAAYSRLSMFVDSPCPRP